MAHEGKLAALMGRVDRNDSNFTPTQAVRPDGTVVADRFKDGKGKNLADFLSVVARKTPAKELNEVFLIEEGLAVDSPLES